MEPRIRPESQNLGLLFRFLNCFNDSDTARLGFERGHPSSGNVTKRRIQIETGSLLSNEFAQFHGVLIGASYNYNSTVTNSF